MAHILLNAQYLTAQSFILVLTVLQFPVWQITKGPYGSILNSFPNQFPPSVILPSLNYLSLSRQLKNQSFLSHSFYTQMLIPIYYYKNRHFVYEATIDQKWIGRLCNLFSSSLVNFPIISICGNVIKERKYIN